MIFIVYCSYALKYFNTNDIAPNNPDNDSANIPRLFSNTTERITPSNAKNITPSKNTLLIFIVYYSLTCLLTIYYSYFLSYFLDLDQDSEKYFNIFIRDYPGAA